MSIITYFREYVIFLLTKIRTCLCVHSMQSHIHCLLCNIWTVKYCQISKIMTGLHWSCTNSSVSVVFAYAIRHFDGPGLNKFSTNIMANKHLSRQRGYWLRHHLDDLNSKAILCHNSSENNLKIICSSLRKHNNWVSPNRKWPYGKQDQHYFRSACQYAVWSESTLLANIMYKY